MSDHNTLTPETDDEIRARVQALAEAVTRGADTEAALRQMPRRSRPPTVGLLAIAACMLAVVALAAVISDRQAVETTDPSGSPTQTTDCPNTSQPRAITQGAQMKNRFAAPVASAATAIMLLGACSDDGPTTLAKGEDVELVGESGLAGQTLNINAEEEDGEVTGEFRVSTVVVRVDCADTDTDGIVILAGEVTTGEPGFMEVGDLLALSIREGDPDSVHLHGQIEGAESCQEELEGIPEDLLNDPSNFVPVEDGEDIETG